MVNLRIAVIGSHGVGKTGLVTKLSDETGLPVISEQARVVAKNMGITNSTRLLDDPDLARTFQWQVLNQQIQMQLRLNSGFISDRSTLDCIAYWKLYLGNTTETAQYINKARIHASTTHD